MQQAFGEEALKRSVERTPSKPDPVLIQTRRRSCLAWPAHIIRALRINERYQLIRFKFNYSLNSIFRRLKIHSVQAFVRQD